MRKETVAIAPRGTGRIQDDSRYDNGVTATINQPLSIAYRSPGSHSWLFDIDALVGVDVR